jgi:hypothetical protein
MNNQSGIGLSEVLISLFLTSIILMLLTQIYLSNKRQYIEIKEILAASFDLQWVSDLLSDSIRRAGFTPCLGVNQLETIDRRNYKKNLRGIKLEEFPHQLIQINRMSELFTRVINFQSPTKLIVSNAILFKEPRPVLIADCEHAEVQQILSIDKLAKGYLVTLAKPIMFSYAATAYIGEWFEEKWFIRKNIQNENTLHYKLFQTEELTPLVHSLKSNLRGIHEKQLVEITLGLDKDKTHQLIVAIRGS